MRKLRESYDAGRFDFYSPDEIGLLAAHAATEQDAAIFVTAAFTGLRRGELIALRWGEVDFANRSIRVVEGYTRKRQGRTKSRRSRTVPMVEEVARVLAAIRAGAGRSGAKDLVFPGRGPSSSTARRFAADTSSPARRPASDRCGFTTCATPSARWPSTARRSCRSRPGWGTLT